MHNAEELGLSAQKLSTNRQKSIVKVESVVLISNQGSYFRVAIYRNSVLQFLEKYVIRHRIAECDAVL